MLSPQHSSDIHNAVADLMKGIISMATPTPASGLLDPSPASNLFARELASKEMVEKMTSYIVHEFSTPKTTPADPFGDASPSDSIPEIETEALPSLDSSISSVTNSISIIIELIRKNNSDYFEPYLFHTLRNRLIHLQQHLTEEPGNNPEETRDILEQAMKELVNRMGVVNLGPVLGVVGESMEQLKKFLRNPRSLVRVFVLFLFFYRLVTFFERYQSGRRYSNNSRIRDTSHIRTFQNLRTLCGVITLFKHGTPQSPVNP